MDLSLETERLKLVAANAALAKLELNDRPALFARLGASAPEEWPPPLNDDGSFRYFLGMLESDPAFTGWGYWYVLKKPEDLIGICGFKGRPDAAGMAEVGYSIIPSRQRQGFASEAVNGLIGWAKARGAKIIAAETFPDLIASIGVMEKNELRFIGAGSEEGAVRYQRELQ